MKEETKTKLANGWLSTMWIGFASGTLILGSKYPLVFWGIISGLLAIRMTIWSIKQVSNN